MRKRAAWFRLVGCWVVGLIAACSGGAPSGVVERCDDRLALPPSVATDILFVIDNSSSMAEEQAKVAAELETFVQTLADSPIENDFQVGVITTGVTVNAGQCDGTNVRLLEFDEQSGRLQLGKDAVGTEVPESERKILGVDDADLVEQFALLVQQGTSGPGQEMGFEAVRRALSDPIASMPTDGDPPGNEGFLRPGSRLLVVIVSDEDDCSDPDGDNLVLQPTSCGGTCTDDSDCGGQGQYCLEDRDDPSVRFCETNVCETPEGRAALEPVETYVEFLKSLDDGTGTGRTRDVSLAVIGAVDPSGDPERCSSGSDEAQGIASRYVEAVELMGDRGYIDSICRDSYESTLEQVAALVNAPQVIELPDDPVDGNLVRVTIERQSTSETIECSNGDGFTFEPAVGDAPARIVMEGRCRLRSSDDLNVRFVCAG